MASHDNVPGQAKAMSATSSAPSTAIAPVLQSAPHGFAAQVLLGAMID